MNDTASPPSRLLKITAATARWILGFLIAAWLLFVVAVVVLHAWIVPRIGNYREALALQASKAIGVPVYIGAISADSEGLRGSLFPTFELRDVVLYDAQERESLRLARVVASMSPRSLWHLRLEQLYVEQPVVDLRMDAAGKLHVAGIDVGEGQGEAAGGDSRAADWIFSQREIAVRGGTLRWTDERRQAPPLLLTDVDLVLRNSARRHRMRLDATPPPEWGARFSLRGHFNQPLLSAHSGAWKEWVGAVYADLPRFDVRQLGQYVQLDQRIREGSGALRAWGDVRRGELVGGAADVALKAVDVTLAKDLQPLVLRGLSGRLEGQLEGSLEDGSLSFATQGLQFETDDDLHWPGGNFSVQRTAASARTPGHGRFQADRLDLAMITRIADRLPLARTVREHLLSRAPRGLVQQIDLAWQGDFDAPQRYQAKGRVSELALAALPGEAAAAPPEPAVHPGGAEKTAAAAPPVPVGVPGVRGASIDFDATQAGGSASVAIRNGAIDLPGVFEEPEVPIDSLSGQLEWTREGEARIDWHTSDPAVSRSHQRLPGVLDLQGKLTRADGTRVHRYLPLEIPQETRHYVRDAVTKGTASVVDFRVRGDLHDMPFLDPRQGEFRILAKVADVNYAYVPPVAPAPAAKGAPQADWPALTGVSGELLFERAGMHIRNVRGHVVGAAGIELTRGEAQIADMSVAKILLKVEVQAEGPLESLVRAGTPLLATTADKELAAHATLSGTAGYKLQLDMPLAELDKTQLQASVALDNNAVQLTPELPGFTQLKGTLNFTEAGFSVAALRARLLGGDIRLDGKGRFSGPEQGATLHAQGVATAEGLRALRESTLLARLGRSMSGSAPYSVDFSVRDHTPEFLITSSLQGMALSLPAPLAKAAEDVLPLRLEKKVVLRGPGAAGASSALRDSVSIDIGSAASVRYLRELGGALPRVIRGGIALGAVPGDTPAMPEQGVQLNVDVPRLDMDAWRTLVGAPDSGEVMDADDPMLPYLPNLVAVRADQVQTTGRTINQVVLGASREGPLWRANVDSHELSGYLEYRPAQAGRLMARLARLKIARSDASQVESLLDERVNSLPALDVVVDEFELLGKQLGRVEIDAVNRGGAQREWRVNRLSLTTPEAKFNATGSWAAVAGAGGAGARRTSMDFTLDIADAGDLLTRLGMPGVLRRGRGQMAGTVGWSGSPFSIDYPSLDGQMHVDVASGQFLQAEPGLAKLLGVLSLQALPRRLTLDFRDVFSAGFAFDFIRGDASLAHGVASTNNLQMQGVTAEALMDGSADIAHETQNLRVVVVPEIGGATASLLATAISPALGLGTYLAQLALRKPLLAAATQEFDISGTWADPEIKKVPRRPELDIPPERLRKAVPEAPAAAPASPVQDAGSPSTEKTP